MYISYQFSVSGIIALFIGHPCNIPGVSPNWLSPSGSNCNYVSASSNIVLWYTMVSLDWLNPMEI